MSEITTILIVDDEPAGRETLEALLSSQAYQLRFAGNGPDALTQAAAQPPDLILLDVMMPGMDGFAVCQRLRADPLLGEVPIIMLTALDDRTSRLQGIEAGADDFISKPFDRVELRARVRTITRLNRYRRLLAERARFARVIELAPDGILIVDSVGAIVLANPAMVRLLGTQPETGLLGQCITAFVVPEQREECCACLREVMADPGATARFETMLVCSGGRRLPVEIHVGFFAWDSLSGAQIIARDITERKRAELLEEERQHTAYELHDGLAQVVTSVHQYLQAYAGRRRPRSPQARAELTSLLELARRAVKEGRSRSTILGWRPRSRCTPWRYAPMAGRSPTRRLSATNVYRRRSRRCSSVLPRKRSRMCESTPRRHDRTWSFNATSGVSGLSCRIGVAALSRRRCRPARIRASGLACVGCASASRYWVGIGASRAIREAAPW